MLLLAAPSVAPLFTARFVPYSAFGNPLEVYVVADARRDGTAVGKVFYRTTNDAATQPFTIFGGRAIRPKVRVPEQTTYVYPRAILGERRIVVSNVGPYSPPRPPVYRTATIAPDRLVVSANLYAKPVVTAPRLSVVEPYDEPTIEIPRDFYPARYRRDRKYPIGHAKAVWLPLAGGGAIGMAAFTPPPSDEGDPLLARFDTDYLGLVYHHGRVRPLREVVRGGYDFRQLAWASPDGWYIFSADRGKERGLAWLTPVNRKR